MLTTAREEFKAAPANRSYSTFLAQYTFQKSSLRTKIAQPKPLAPYLLTFTDSRVMNRVTTKQNHCRKSN